ncbi:MAG: hypothetical protein QUV05_22385 [Phycisphaerae bacterium]|nr:hypothetical protein [Phycisphaerae bacterium]
MGILNKLFGGADGIRETIVESYVKHRELAESGMIPSSDDPHRTGLYGALASRYKARATWGSAGVPSSETVIWADLAPFVAMPEPLAVQALAEYVVYQEMPDQAMTTTLTWRIELALMKMEDISLKQMAVMGLANKVAWSSLISDFVKQDLMKALEPSADSTESSSTHRAEGGDPDL